jgi:hypothetical protein
MMFLLRLGARRQVTHKLRYDQTSRANFMAVFGVDSFPHGDTLNELYKRLSVDEVQESVSSVSETLIRAKVLYPYRVLDRYYVVVIDGTGMLRFNERHCEHCLTKTLNNGKTLYYHSVLEAKLVTHTGLAFSLMTEFIENAEENPSKQDCELKAFYRLASRIKERFPRLPILLSLDGLYAGGPTFSLCERYGWKYVIVLGENDLPSVNEEFSSLRALCPQNQLVLHTGKKAEIDQHYSWVNAISYVDTEKREHVLSVVQCLETKPKRDGQRKTTRFKWLTNLTVKKQNVAAVASEGGRIRWKIENEGFNVQKNGGYGLEHAYSNDWVAERVFYLLLQIACILSQLIERGSLLKHAFPKGLGSAENLAFRLLEAWRNLMITQALLEQVRSVRFQIRLDSS